MGLWLLKEALLSFLKAGTTAACFHKVGRYCQGKLGLKICFKTGIKVSEQHLITKLRVLSRLTDFDGLRCLKALKTSES